jgi:hypothetical protein
MRILTFIANFLAKVTYRLASDLSAGNTSSACWKSTFNLTRAISLCLALLTFGLPIFRGRKKVLKKVLAKMAMSGIEETCILGHGGFVLFQSTRLGKPGRQYTKWCYSGHRRQKL